MAKEKISLSQAIDILEENMSFDAVRGSKRFHFGLCPLGAVLEICDSKLRGLEEELFGQDMLRHTAY